MKHETPAPAGNYQCRGKDYFIIVHYFFSIWKIDHLPGTESSTVVKMLKKCSSATFAWQGIPDVTISNNDPQFACKQFSNFANE